MSQFRGAWVPADLCRRKDLSPSEKLILGYCASFSGRCFASDAHIAEAVGLSEKTVSNTLSRLRSKGVINGRDFPKIFTEVPLNGNRVPYLGNIEQSLEQREEQRYEFPKTGSVVKSQDSLTDEELRILKKHYTYLPHGDELIRALNYCAAKEAREMTA